MKPLFIAVLAISIFACRQNSSPKKESLPPLKKEPKKILTPRSPLASYIHHPDKDDSLCTKAIAKAEFDVLNNHLFFCLPSGFVTVAPRYIKYLLPICQQYNLVIRYVKVTDDYSSGDQTRGCYLAYMDSVVEHKYGKGFKNKLIIQADGLLSVSNDTIYGGDCDSAKKPRLQDCKGDDGGEIYVKMDKSLKEKVKEYANDTNFIMDIWCIIDRLGQPSGYSLKHVEDHRHVIYDRCENQLFKIAIDMLRKHNKSWISGQIKGRKVITEQCVHFYFR
jgi:hypothetical protein